MKLNVREIAQAVSGEIIQGNSDAVFDSISTDTRKIGKGDLFFALIGENFDAHDFLDKAITGNAGGLVVSRRVDVGSWTGPVILVKDTLIALQELARYNRKKFNGLVIGVTGSNGKTTTKDMISSVLEQKYVTLKTQGNLNNHIGLPITMLKLDDKYGAAVFEMGMSGLGEIDLLAGLAKPDGAVITNIGETHLEKLGSIANIAKAKGEILDHIGTQGFAILNGDNQLVRQQAERCQGKKVFFGTTGDVEIMAKDIENFGESGIKFKVVTARGKLEIKLPIPGKHNALNAMAAVGVGLEAGLSLEQIKHGLENTALTSMRLEILEGQGITIINDTYNANPASTKAALQILADMHADRRKVAILGDMYELGRRAVEGHREVGAEAAARHINVLITVGKLAAEIALGASMADEPIEIASFNTNAELKQYLPRVIRPGDIILVKGSRGMKLEQVVENLLQLDLP